MRWSRPMPALELLLELMRKKLRSLEAMCDEEDDKAAGLRCDDDDDEGACPLGGVARPILRSWGCEPEDDDEPPKSWVMLAGVYRGQ